MRKSPQWSMSFNYTYRMKFAFPPTNEQDNDAEPFAADTWHTDETLFVTLLLIDRWQTSIRDRWRNFTEKEQFQHDI